MVYTSKSRVRAWCFTSYKMDESYQDVLTKIGETLAEYIIWGEETCPTTGKAHHQGYVYFKNGKSMKSVKKIFKDPTLHLEAAKGTAVQNIKYCSKGGVFRLWAARPFKGSGTTSP